MKDGGRAFPALPHYERVGNNHHFYEGSYGMTLRQWYAGMAMQGIMASWEGAETEHLPTISIMAFKMADAMIAEDNHER